MNKSIDSEEFRDLMRSHRIGRGNFDAIVAYIDKERASIVTATVEACAKAAEGRGFIHDAAPDAMFAKACSAAIRRDVKPESILSEVGDHTKSAPEEITRYTPLIRWYSEGDEEFAEIMDIPDAKGRFVLYADVVNSRK